MANTKRKDKSRKVLRKGESQRSDGTYQYRWTDVNRKRQCIYAKNLDDLRYKEEEIDKDKKTVSRQKHDTQHLMICMSFGEI